MKEKRFTDFNVFIDYENEICQLLNSEGNLIWESNKYYFDKWLFKDSLFVKNLAILASFDENNYHNILYHKEKGILHLDNIRIIDDFIWNDMMHVKSKNDMYGLLNFNLEWVLPPECEYADFINLEENYPYLEFQKNGENIFFLENNILFPSAGFSDAEVVLYDTHYHFDAHNEELFQLIIKEKNNICLYHFIYIEKIDRGKYKTYISPCNYMEDITADEEGIYYIENNIKSTWHYKNLI
jgi:hypothetical protein